MLCKGNRMSVKEPPESKPNKVLLRINTDWRKQLVVTAKQAQMIMEALSTAELYDDSGTPTVIKPLEDTTVKMEMISHSGYVQAKMAGLVTGDSDAS